VSGCSRDSTRSAMASINRFHPWDADPSAALGLVVGIHGTVYARMCEIGGTNFLRKRLL
jgi:hypothetical protein